MYIYICIHLFRPSQDSSVWLGLTSREQLDRYTKILYKSNFVFIFILFFFQNLNKVSILINSISKTNKLVKQALIVQKYVIKS